MYVASREWAQKNPETIKAFRKDYYLWNQVGEYPFDAFMMSQQRANAL